MVENLALIFCAQQFKALNLSSFYLMKPSLIFIAERDILQKEF